MSYKKQIIKVSGLHCQSCKTLIEEELKDLPGVNSVCVDFKNGTCDLKFEEDKTSISKIKHVIRKLGYSPEEEEASSTNFNFWFGLLAPLFVALLILGYLGLSRFGAFSILARLNEKNIGYALIFLIGILASFHCVGMCGGIVVAYSASAKSEGKKFAKYIPHILYNTGRVISYTLMGALLGGLGSVFSVTPFFSGVVMIVAGLLMLAMALNLVTNFSLLQKLNSFLPQTIARYIFGQKKSKNPKGPLAIGLLTGLMPCGPLQAMQLYALGSGSPLVGGLSLLVYSLGTVPLMFGFGAFITTLSKKYMKNAFKASAVVVAILAVVMLARGLNNISQAGTPAGSDNPGKIQAGDTANAGEYQTVKMSVTRYGYEPDTIYIKKGIPVRWVIDGSGISGCTSAIKIPGLKIYQRLTRGENVIEFAPTQTGELPFACGMQMVWGKFIVQ